MTSGILEDENGSGAERKRKEADCERLKGWTLADSEAARCGDGATAKRQRRTACGISATADPKLSAPGKGAQGRASCIYKKEEKLLREFPRCEHCLLRAFGGLDPRRFGSCSRGFLVAGTEPRRNICRSSLCRRRIWIRFKVVEGFKFRGLGFRTFYPKTQNPEP
jgi:hypothetical protein